MLCRCGKYLRDSVEECPECGREIARLPSADVLQEAKKGSKEQVREGLAMLRQAIYGGSSNGKQ